MSDTTSGNSRQIQAGRSPSREEVDGAIATLTTPSPTSTSSTLPSTGNTRSRLAYYKSSASPTNSENFQSLRRSLSPPASSPSRATSALSASSNTRVTSFSTHLPTQQNKEGDLSNLGNTGVYQPQQEVNVYEQEDI